MPNYPSFYTIQLKVILYCHLTTNIKYISWLCYSYDFFKNNLHDLLRNYFSKLCKSFLIYHSEIFISPNIWMNDYFSSFLLPMGKCITLMGTQNNIVYSNAQYTTLIIGKWSLAHTVEPKKFFTFQKN